MLRQTPCPVLAGVLYALPAQAPRICQREAKRKSDAGHVRSLELFEHTVPPSCHDLPIAALTHRILPRRSVWRDLSSLLLLEREEANGCLRQRYFLNRYPSNERAEVIRFSSPCLFKKGCSLVCNGTNPTILAAYSGFRSSQILRFRRWHAGGSKPGGIYALANIRGGVHMTKSGARQGCWNAANRCLMIALQQFSCRSHSDIPLVRASTSAGAATAAYQSQPV